MSAIDKWRDSLPKQHEADYTKEKSNDVVSLLKQLVSKSGSKQVAVLQKCLIELYNRLKAMAAKGGADYPSSSSDRNVAKCCIRCCTHLLAAVMPLARNLNPESGKSEDKHVYKVVLALLATFQSMLKAFPNNSFKTVLEPAAYEHVSFFCRLTGVSTASSSQENVRPSPSNSRKRTKLSNGTVSDADWNNMMKVVISAIFDFMRTNPSEQSYEWVSKWADLLRDLGDQWDRIKSSLPENVSSVVSFCWLKGVRHNTSVFRQGLEELNRLFEGKRQLEAFIIDLIKHVGDARGVAARHGAPAISTSEVDDILETCIHAIRGNKNSLRTGLEIVDLIAPSSPSPVNWQQSKLYAKVSLVVSETGQSILDDQIQTQMLLAALSFSKDEKKRSRVSKSLVEHLPKVCDLLESTCCNMCDARRRKDKTDWQVVLSRGVVMTKFWNAKKVEDFFRQVCDNVDEEIYDVTSRFLVVVCHYFSVLLLSTKNIEYSDAEKKKKGINERVQVMLAALSTLRLIISKGVFKQISSWGDELNTAPLGVKNGTLLRWFVKHLLELEHALLVEHDVFGIVLQTFQVGVSRYSDNAVLQSLLDDLLSVFAAKIIHYHRRKYDSKKEIEHCISAMKLLDVLTRPPSTDHSQSKLDSMRDLLEAIFSRLYVLRDRIPENDIFPQKVGKLSLTIKTMILHEKFAGGVGEVNNDCWEYIVEQMVTTSIVRDSPDSQIVGACRCKLEENESLWRSAAAPPSNLKEMNGVLLRFEQAELLSILDNQLDRDKAQPSPFEYRYILAAAHFQTFFSICDEESVDESLFINSWECACRLAPPSESEIERPSDDQLLHFLVDLFEKSKSGSEDKNSQNVLLRARVMQAVIHFHFHQPEFEFDEQHGDIDSEDKIRQYRGFIDQVEFDTRYSSSSSFWKKVPFTCFIRDLIDLHLEECTIFAFHEVLDDLISKGNIVEESELRELCGEISFSCDEELIAMACVTLADPRDAFWSGELDPWLDLYILAWMTDLPAKDSIVVLSRLALLHFESENQARELSGFLFSVAERSLEKLDSCDKSYIDVLAFFVISRLDGRSTSKDEIRELKIKYPVLADTEHSALWKYVDFRLNHAVLEKAVAALTIIQVGLKQVQQSSGASYSRSWISTQSAVGHTSVGEFLIDSLKKQIVLEALETLSTFFIKAEYTAAALGYLQQMAGLSKSLFYRKYAWFASDHKKLINEGPDLNGEVKKNYNYGAPSFESFVKLVKESNFPNMQPPTEISVRAARKLLDCLQQINDLISFNLDGQELSKMRASLEKNFGSCKCDDKVIKAWIHICVPAALILKNGVSIYDGRSIRRAAGVLFSIALQLLEKTPSVKRSRDKTVDPSEIPNIATEILTKVVGIMSGTMATIVDLFRDLHREGKIVHEPLFSEILCNRWLAKIPDTISLSFIRVCPASKRVVFCCYVPSPLDKLAVASTITDVDQMTTKVDGIITEDRALREKIISARKRKKDGDSNGSAERPPSNAERLVTSNDNMKQACDGLQTEFGPVAFLLLPWHKDRKVNERVVKWAQKVCGSGVPWVRQIVCAKAVLGGYLRTARWKTSSVEEDIAIGNYCKLVSPLPHPPAVGGSDDLQVLSLFIDPECNNVPWESLPLFRNLSVTRAISPVHLVRTLMRINGVETVPKDGFYVMNPGGDLNNIEKNLLHVFAHQVKKKKIQWHGTVGAPGPGERKALQAMGQFETFLHLGHGHGQSYLAGNLIQYGATSSKEESHSGSKPIKATTLMMGCCSAKFLLPPGADSQSRLYRVEPFGAPLNFLIGATFS